MNFDFEIHRRLAVLLYIFSIIKSDKLDISLLSTSGFSLKTVGHSSLVLDIHASIADMTGIGRI